MSYTPTPYEKRVHSKRKEFAPSGANYLLLEWAISEQKKNVYIASP